MQLFNITVIADEKVGKIFESWLRQTHLPSIKKTGLFASVRLLRVTNPPNEGLTYCIQFTATEEASILQYKEQFMPALKEKAKREYSEHLFFIESMMEFIDLDMLPV